MRWIVHESKARWLCLLCAIGFVALQVLPIDAPPVAAQETPPDRSTLPVVLRAQETEVWCWAATGQMVMEFMGKEVTQGAQANLAFRRTDCAQSPTPRACIRGGDILIRPYGFSHDITTKPMSEAAIVYQIHNLRKPIPFAWRWPGGGGHAALVVGYSRQPDAPFLVECLDPYPPPGRDPRAWSGGHRVFIPYSRWVSDYDHSFALAYFNVTRKI
jgi:hypothetical protein